jgi:L-aminopeptidase/D-esterase-like protein
VTAPEPIGPFAAAPPGPHNDLTDIAGLRIGHAERVEDGWLTGTTVLLAPDGGMVAGVDVRGGAPGTRETDLLHPTASVQRVHAVVLTGGSAYGLAAADGVVDELGRSGIGFPVGGPGEVVPIVPAAVIFDLGRGGAFSRRPDADFGRRAVADARSADTEWMRRMGPVGAGLGAAACGLKGGLGMASSVLPDGTVVAALVVTNAAGSPIHPETGELLAGRALHRHDGDPGVPTEDERRAMTAVLAERDPRRLAAQRNGPVLENTTIGVVVTDALLDKAQCTKLAAVGHDGLARALDPIHTSFDGDTLFGLSTASRPAPDELAYVEILTTAARVVTRAVGRSLLAARSVSTPAGTWPSWGDLAPSAYRAASSVSRTAPSASRTAADGHRTS